MKRTFLGSIGVGMLLLISAAVPSICSAYCFTNHLSCSASWSSQNAYPTVASYSAGCDDGFSYTNANYDLVGGHWHVEGYGRGAGCFTQMDTWDTYVITGPPAGTPVDCDAVLRASGRSAFVRLQVDSSANKIDYGYPAGGPTAYLHLHLHQVAGESFLLHVQMFTGGGEGRGGQGTADLSFEYLPFGAAVNSCFGYTQFVTPVKTASWGRLRQIYR